MDCVDGALSKRPLVACALATAVLLVSGFVNAQETITVEPAGVVSWGEMLEWEALGYSAAQTEARQATPFMPGPAPREIGALPSVARPGAPLPEPPTVLSPLPPTLSTNFLALPDNNGGIPPDTMGAIGPAHAMTMLNTEVRIQNKVGGVISTVSLWTFWNVGTGLTGSPFDPKLVYDSLSGRWIATVDANSRSATSQVWFAISATSDPTGAWTFYGYGADAAFPSGVTWADYPGFGVNSTWIAITNNMYPVPTGSFVGVKMWVIDKASALAGGTLTTTVFATGFTVVGGAASFTLKPAVTFDAAEPKLYLADNSGYWDVGIFLLRMSEITGTGPAPAWAPTAGGPFPGSGLFFVANNFNFNQIGAPQQGAAGLVQTNDPRMLNAVLRDGRVWCTHSAGLPALPSASDRTAVFWYQINPVGLSIVQSGVVDGGAGVHHFFPSITANKHGDACLGFSRSDATRYVEGVFTGRMVADPLGTMRPIAVLKAGEDSYIKDFSSGRIRWGDYSATVVDPVDDETFWTLQEYAALDVGPGSSDDRWGTWWGKKAVARSSETPTVTPTNTPLAAATPTPRSVPTPLTPSGTIADTTPTFSWTAVVGASKYLLAVYDKTAGSYVILKVVTGATSYTPGSALNPTHSYKWKARAYTGGWGIYSGWLAFSYSIGRPAPLAPSGTIADTTPTFSWTAVAGASKYFLAVYDKTAGSYTILKVVSGATNHTPAAALNSAHAYKWKVRAYAGGWGSFSGWLAFNYSIGVPTPLSPSRTISDTTPTFSWTAVAGASKYFLAVYDRTAGAYVILEGVTGTTSYTPASALDATHTYKWKVRAYAGGWGSYSGWLFFGY